MGIEDNIEITENVELGYKHEGNKCLSLKRYTDQRVYKEKANIEESRHQQARTEDGGDTGELENVLDDHAGGGKHANTTVLELSLAKPLNIDELADAKGIEANITGLRQQKTCQQPADWTSADAARFNASFFADESRT